MLQPCPATARLAAAVVHAQLAIDGSARSRGPAPNVVKRLHTRFSKLFGTAGFDALLARSLALAQWDRPCLDELRASPGETLERLDACTSDGALDHDAAIAIVSRFLELMIQLVGEDLTLRLLREAGSATMEVMLNDGTR